MSTEYNVASDNSLEYETLQEKLELGVEETDQLVKTIREYQGIRHNHQLAILAGRFTHAEDLDKAQTYLRELDDWLSNLWRRLTEITTRVLQYFLDTVKWIRTQMSLLNNGMLYVKSQQMVANESDKNVIDIKRGITFMDLYMQSEGMTQDYCVPVSDTQIFLLQCCRLEVLENLVCTLKNEINRYLLIISDMEKLNRECEQFIQKCRLMSEECQKHQSELEEITTTLAQKRAIIYQEASAGSNLL